MIANATTTQRIPRDPAIDLTKGWAILAVLLIHSNALHGNFVFRNIVNHAVGVFVVLFGVNATFWWQRRTPSRDWRAWYARWVSRLMVPVWAMLPLWWAMALYFRPWGVTLSWALPFVQAVGYLQYIGTGWFVTLAIQLALLQPLLESLSRRFGHALLLAIAVALTVSIIAVASVIIRQDQLIDYAMFSPRVLAHVTFGMALAPYVCRLGWREGLGAAAVLALTMVVREAWGVGATPIEEVEPIRKVVDGEAMWLGALALTVVLLVVLRPVARVPVVAPVLEWLGQNSYGVYIGQLIVHNFFVYSFGLRGFYERVPPWPYTAALLAGGVGFTWLGEELRRAVRTLRAQRVSPKPFCESPPP